MHYNMSLCMACIMYCMVSDFIWVDIPICFCLAFVTFLFYLFYLFTVTY